MAHDEIALLGPEADRVKGAGDLLDDDDNPGHYLATRSTIIRSPAASS